MQQAEIMVGIEAFGHGLEVDQKVQIAASGVEVVTGCGSEEFQTLHTMPAV